MEMAGSADLFGWVTSSAQELEGGRALLRPLLCPGCVPAAILFRPNGSMTFVPALSS